MATVYTVSETARLLGVSVATVRRIADEMADILPDYQHAPGQARKLSQADVLTISALWTRLQADTALTRSALLAELSAPGSEPLIIPDSLPTPTAQKAPDSIEMPQAIQTTSPLPENALAPFLQAQDDTRQQLERLSAQLAEIERRPAQPAPATSATPLAMAALISVGVLIVSLTVSALSQWAVAGVAGSALALLILIVGLVVPSMRR